MGSASVNRHRLSLLLLTMLCAGSLAASFTPPRNLDPQSGIIRLDNSYQDEAWLVYTYEIDTDGNVVNARIQSSNGVPEVELAVLQQVNSMHFSPAMRNGKPVKVSADPIYFTWILDQERQLTASFSDLYQQAWDKFREEDYDGAFEIAVQLKEMPGRNAYEEVKFQILAASLASRWDDQAAEIQHLNRATELQALADSNNFRNPYIEGSQYLAILDRIHTLEINRNMLADAAITLRKIEAIGLGTEPVIRARERQENARRRFMSQADVRVEGELTPIYRDGPGSWKIGLTRDKFSLREVRGKINSVFLSCDQGETQLRFPSSEPWTSPAGWSNCRIDISGRAGTRFALHQLAP